MTEQERYWREMDQLKVHTIYLELYLEKTMVIDRCIKMFLAITSSSSIAGWVIWRQYSFIWATLIAGSQALGAIKPYLPFAQRLSSLRELTNDLESLFLSMEDRWHDIAEGHLTLSAIHSARMHYKEKKQHLLRKHLTNTSLPHKEKFMAQAIEDTKVYFSTFY